ncbi:MAG: diacylglycerol/lipid kinase family protein [Acutalibacteraceae bacterium]
MDTQNKQKRKVLLIVNPCAGRTKSRAGTFDIVNKFSNNDYDFSIHTTTCRGDATNIVKKHYEGKDLVVCCGGDGTLNETINGIMEMPNRVPVGYIPTGSTNDLATTLGIPNDIKKATDLIMDGHTNSYDIGLFNNRCFSYVASFGAFTSASYSTSQKLKNKIGHAAYLLNGVKDWKSIRSTHARIEYDGGVIDDDFMLGAIANSTSVAGLFKFNPKDVKLNDGYFELLLVKKIKPIQAPIFLRKLIKQEYDGEQIIFVKTRNLKIVSEEPIAWTLDGEYGGAHKVSMIHVLTKAVDICSPVNPLFESDDVQQPADETTENAEETESEETEKSKENEEVSAEV